MSTVGTLYDETVKYGSAKLLSVAPASNSASLDFLNLTFDFPVYVFDLVAMLPTVMGSNLLLRISTNNGATFDVTEGYHSHWSYSMSHTTGGAHGSYISGAGAHRTWFYIGNLQNSGATLIGRVIFYRRGLSGGRHFEWWSTTYRSDAGTGTMSIVGHGVQGSYMTVDAVRFYYSSGTIASGVIRCYGMRPG